MNTFTLQFKMAIDDLLKNKIRTLLTSLGILIGVLAVVLLIAFGQGLKNYVNKQFEDLGTNVIYVYPGNILAGGANPGGGTLGGAQFDDRDLASLRRLELPKYVVPIFVKRSSVRVGSEKKSSDLYATTPDIFEVRNLKPIAGRLFTASEVSRRAKVVVLGPTLATELYGSAERAVGQSLRVDTQRYSVIGVVQSKGGSSLGGPDYDSYTYLPYGAAQAFNPKGIVFAFFVQAKKEEDIPVLKQQVKRLLLKRYNEDDFSVIEQTEILEIVGSVFRVIDIVLLAIGSISLLVGGIGIMNIMYAVVTERTAEIGIRRSLGATKQNILWLFLSQSLALSLVGGLLGLGLAVVVVVLIQVVFPAAINVFSVFVALGVSSFIGVFFGVFPAWNAANRSPIEAIRYE